MPLKIAASPRYLPTALAPILHTPVAASPSGRNLGVAFGSACVPRKAVYVHCDCVATSFAHLVADLVGGGGGVIVVGDAVCISTSVVATCVCTFASSVAMCVCVPASFVHRPRCKAGAAVDVPGDSKRPTKAPMMPEHKRKKPMVNPSIAVKK